MTSIYNFSAVLFLTVASLSATMGPAQTSPPATNPNKQEDQATPTRETRGNPTDKGTTSASPILTITVVNEQLMPIKGATVILFAADSDERKTTGAEGKVTFQLRRGPLTLRVTADHMNPHQELVPNPEEPKDTVHRVVMESSSGT